MEARDLTGGLRAAAALAEVDHKTVAHYVALRDAGQAPDPRPRRITGWYDAAPTHATADARSSTRPQPAAAYSTKPIRSAPPTSQVLAHWPTADVTMLCELLERFNRDVEHHPSLPETPGPQATSTPDRFRRLDENTDNPSLTDAAPSQPGESTSPSCGEVTRLQGRANSQTSATARSA